MDSSIDVYAESFIRGFMLGLESNLSRPNRVIRSEELLQAQLAELQRFFVL